MFDSAVSMTLLSFCICKYLPKIEIIYKNTLAYEKGVQKDKNCGKTEIKIS